MWIHINDRSALDAIVAKSPSRTVTLREELERGQFCPRCDVVLVNGTRSGHEYALYVTETGFAGNLSILDWLSDEQHLEVMRIATQMRVNAKEFAPAAKLLANR